jgi:hypothetical protein
MCASGNLNLCFHDLFDAQVLRSPHTIALICGDEQVTYEELHRRAGQLALQLQALGVMPNTLVGICVQRSVDMVVGILGILKSGGAYVPLDPAYPRDRLSVILEDANIQVAVTQANLPDVLPTEVQNVGAAWAESDSGCFCRGFGIRDLYIWLYRNAQGCNDHSRKPVSVCSNRKPGIGRDNIRRLSSDCFDLVCVICETVGDSAGVRGTTSDRRFRTDA